MMDLTFADEDITHQFLTLTSSQARHLRDTTPYAFQRAVDPTYVQEYMQAMRRGEFRPATELVFARWKNTRVCVNGQHTLEALAQGEVAALRVSIVEFRCTRESQIHALYLTFDRNRLRSLTQLYAAYDFGTKHGLNGIQTKHLGAAMPLIVSGFAANATQRLHYGKVLHSGYIRMACMADWVDEALVFYETIKGSPKEINSLLRRGAIMAVALVTLRHTGADAEDFWRAVAWDDMLASNDPRKTLHKWIRENTALNFQSYLYARYVAAGWNAAWQDRPLQRLSVHDNTSVPIRIEGTPHDGIKHYRYLSDNGDVLHHPMVVSGGRP
jgi:hypothetical protein